MSFRAWFLTHVSGFWYLAFPIRVSLTNTSKIPKTPGLNSTIRHRQRSKTSCECLLRIKFVLVGLMLCMGCPVDKDLMNLISVEVINLEKQVENIKKSSTDEAKRISDALQITTEEVQNFYTRIRDIESRLEAEQMERLKEHEALSGTIEGISKGLTITKKRVVANEENISLLEGKQNDLEATLSSVKEEQENLTSKVGALQIERSQLGARVTALEDGNLNTISTTSIFHVPSRNPCFCGRSSELEAIAGHLKIAGKGCVHSAICGLGGVGKTSLAVEFLWRHEEEYPGGIFWISGENNNLFQRTLSEMARRIGTFEKDWYNSLSRTLDWLGKREELWCLVVDNLDELEMSTEMRKLLTGHWKHAARGHIIVTTRRELVELEEEIGVEESYCIELKCLTEGEGVQFLRMRTGKDWKDDETRELVKELGGLPLALDQAGAYIRCLDQTIQQYVNKYREQKLRLLRNKKARQFVENTPPERLAVNTTWKLNFDHISHISKEMELGEVPTLFMQVCAFLGPDDIPYELINEALNKEGSPVRDSGLWDQADIASLLTKFSLFQRYGANSFSVHRLVQEVIRNQLEKETEFTVLSYAIDVLHYALTNTLSPAEVCETVVEDAVFSVQNPPSLHLWGKLASHTTYLQEHLQNFSARHKESAGTLLYTEKTMRIFNEAGIFLSVSQEKVKAQETQELKLQLLVNLQTWSSENGARMPDYFIDIPLTDRHYKLISYCLRQPPPDCDSLDGATTAKEEANQLREQGNLAVKDGKFKNASELYSSAIDLYAGDFRLFCNRALCYLKLEQPQEALEDCEKCLSLNPYYSKALQRKAWALRDLVQRGRSHLTGQKQAALQLAFHFDPSLRNDKVFCGMFSEAGEQVAKEIKNETQLNFALMTTRGNETMLLHEGEYDLVEFVAYANLQIVGLGQKVVLRIQSNCQIFCSKCYFENIVFPKGNIGLICVGKEASLHMKCCDVSGGWSSCDDFPECNGGAGCIAASLGKPACNRTGKFGHPSSNSGLAGCAGVQILLGSFGLIEECVIHDCGGGGVLVADKGSRLEVRKCDVYKNHQAGLEAREGGKLLAFRNRIFNSGYHGVLLGPDAGECDVNGNMIFENTKEGVLATRNTKQIVIRNNDVHHNRPFGLSLDQNSCLLINNNRIFENGFWGIHAQLRTSATIKENIICGNKCGGIRIGINYSGRIYLDSNTVRDHSGPWLEYDEEGKDLDFPIENEKIAALLNIPQGERERYSKTPILNGNKEFNNREGIYHPSEVGQRFHNGCTFCRLSKDKVKRLKKCPTCHVASYCSNECQLKHWSTHKTICIALKSRYSVVVELIPFASVREGESCNREFGTHLKGIGTGPTPRKNKEFIVKIQTTPMNTHPFQLLVVYDKSLTIDCHIQNPDIFSVIMECGVLGALNRGTSKKAFFWAMFPGTKERLKIFLDHLAPYQEW